MSTDDPGRKGGKRTRTRAALVAAALDVAGEKGFASASLDEIAARAGMTKGAIYSNFANKAELLLAAMAARGLVLSSERGHATSLAAELAAMTQDLKALVRRARGEAALVAEFNLYALGEPDLRNQIAKTYAQGFDGTAGYLAKLEGAGPEPRRLAVILQCVAMGFLIQSFVSPDDVTDSVIEETMRALEMGLTAG